MFVLQLVRGQTLICLYYSVRGHDQRSRPNLPTHMRSVRHSLAVRGDQGL